MKKDIAVIAYDSVAGRAYADQIKSVLGKHATIRNYSILDQSYLHIVPSDLYMLSTDALDAMENPSTYLTSPGQQMEIQVTYRKDALKKLNAIPKGTEVLYVNLTEIMAREAVTQLEQLGITHLKFQLYAPETQLEKFPKIAVTPDEERYVPANIQQTINIGQRVCSTDTIIEAVLRLGLNDVLEEEDFKRYKNSVCANSYYFDRIWAHSSRLESQFDILMEALDQGVIAVNEQGIVYAMNTPAQKVTGHLFKKVAGGKAGTLFPYLPFTKVLKNQKVFPPEIIRINGKLVTVTIRPILKKSRFMGAFAIMQPFKEVENQQNQLRSQLMKKGQRHQAKYHFSDVIGNSSAIEKTKTILAKMAQTQSPILLVGETGTGKELFAHSIHNVSTRKNQPFVAINCGALSESLLESELFGYEEGAFTGAKKGGSPGVFEFAHLGTIFLDEVEGMSSALQVKLLRVLQEGEIMRVGGHEVIHVDVRIVAATNEELEEKVANGTFRKDLYYRLNTLPVLIPPLRDRGDDLFTLIETFKAKGQGNFTLSPEVIATFKNYSWPGNIRQLHNVVDYLNFLGKAEVEIADLPPAFQKLGETKENLQLGERKEPTTHFNLEKAVLQILYEKKQSGKTCGRQSILATLKSQGQTVSQVQVRKILQYLEEREDILVHQGRGGSEITNKGINRLEK